MCNVTALRAQWTSCIDSSRINAMFQCNDPVYNPVCGCNQVTYRNECTAFNVYGVRTYTSGVCSGIDMDVFPIPVGPNSVLHVNLSYPDLISGSMDFKVVDLYGKVFEQRLFNSINRVNLQLDVAAWPTGIYVLLATNNRTVLVQKMSKY